MTNILKDLKELDAKATSAPWSITKMGFDDNFCYKHQIGNSKETALYSHSVTGDNTNTQNANTLLVVKTRNVLPDLLRVIELAEDALNSCGVNEQGQEYFDGIIIQQALSEIRKLKGK